MADKQIDLKEALSIGIGGMVGGGIFAVLGLAVSLAKGGTPISFLLAGGIALLSSYSYVKLSLQYPDRGGTVKFINEAFGRGIFSGGINNLLWISYIIMLALYASAFASYAPNLWSPFQNKTWDYHAYATAIILVTTLINYYSLEVVGKVESWAVTVKLLILTGFIAIGIYGLFQNGDWAQLKPSQWSPTFQLLTGGMVIFVAYEGFELIANAVSDLRDPQRNVPRAYYYSVGIVIVLYFLIAVITVGLLPFNKIAAAEDYVLAEAARPMMGQIGFTVITIAALLSTFSAINATLYGGSKVSYRIAKEAELPHELTGTLWHQPIGLLITAIATIVLVNTLDLANISTAGSMGFLIVFAVVNFTGFRLAAEIQASKFVTLFGAVACLGSLIAMVIQSFQDNEVGVLVSGSLIIACFVLEAWYKHEKKK